MTPEKAFGNVLREIRQERNISQEKLSLESGYHRTYISLLERGEKSPTLSTIFNLCKALGVKPSAVISKVDALFEQSSFQIKKENE